MNFELTQQQAKFSFSISQEPDRLLSLPASSTMEDTGNVFDPDYYMIDTDTKLVYRKEQFRRGDNLPEEMIVRDRRYTFESISELCKSVGLEVQWIRRVRAGDWTTDQPEGSPRAKELLVLCRVPTIKAQQKLF